MKILLVVYDNSSYIHCFPHGIAYIAGALLEEGHDVKIYNQDLHHYPDEHLTEYLNKNKFDIVGVGVVGGYYQYRKLKAISKAIRNSRSKCHYVLGGHGPSPDPEYYFKITDADSIVLGEGELSMVALANALESKNALDDIKGIAFRKGKKVTINAKREPIKDVDMLPYPAWHLFPIGYYRLLRYVNMNSTDFIMPVLSGRGCPFKCTFCYRMDEGFRPRSAEAVIEEIRILKKDYNINTVDFSDELLMSSEERTIEFCNKLIKANLGIKWHCNGRLNYAKKDVLEVMKKAGCIFINYGIEALDNEVLKKMRKGLTVDMITKGVEITLEVGISPGLNIMWGNIGDTIETLQKAVDFLLKYDDCAQLRTLRPVTPYPGSELYYTAIKMGKLKDCEDFYECKHTNSDLLAVNFTELDDDTFHDALFQANKIILDNYYDKHKEISIESARKLYIEKDNNFRGFRSF